MTYREPDFPDEYPVYLRNASDHLSRVEPGRDHRVGRDSECDVVLIDATAARFHAVVTVEGMGLRVRAAPGATPGAELPVTFVDDIRVGADDPSSAYARAGSKIRLASTTLVVEVGAHVEREHVQGIARRREQRKVQVPPMASGDLEEIPLSDLLVLFEASRKSTILILRRREGPGPSGRVRPAARGQIHIEKGDIVHTVLDDREAVDTPHVRAMVMEMMSWARGEFDLEPPCHPPKRTASLKGAELTSAYAARMRREE